jgi:DNA repair photolyase
VGAGTDAKAKANKRLPHFMESGRLIAQTTTGHVINTYERCSLRCVYCCTRAQGRSNPVTTPENLIAQLRRELVEITDRPKRSIGIGCLVDGYVPEEEELGLTRAVIGEMVEQEWPMAVVTKSPLIWRDQDLLRWRGVSVQVSISSLDDEALLEFEPHVPPASARLEAVLRLASEGVDVAVAAIPWIPEVTNIEAIIEAVPDTVPILVGPLDVQPDVIGPGRISKRYDRQKVNDAYLAERDRIGKLDHVAWRPPTGLPGTQEGIDGGEIYSHTGKVAFKFLVRNRNVPRDDFASGPVSN